MNGARISPGPRSQRTKVGRKPAFPALELPEPVFAARQFCVLERLAEFLDDLLAQRVFADRVDIGRRVDGAGRADDRGINAFDRKSELQCNLGLGHKT